MDFFDEIMPQNPKESFFMCLKNGNQIAIEKAFEEHLNHYFELLGKNGENKSDFDDFYIDFVAKVYSSE